MEPVLVKTGNGNLSFLIIVTEPPIKQHVQAQFTKLPKNILNYFSKKEGFLEFIMVYKNSKQMYLRLNQMRKKQRRKYI